MKFFFSFILANTCLQKSNMKKLCLWTTVNTITAIVRTPQLKTTCAVFPLTTHVSWYLPSCRCGSIVTLNPPLNPPRPPPPSYTNTKKLSTILPTCTFDKQNTLTILVKMHAFAVKYAIPNFNWKTLRMVDFAPKLQGSNFSSLLKLQTPQRNFLINQPPTGDLLAWENSRRFAMPLVVSQRNDIWAHKFHTDNASLPRSG